MANKASRSFGGASPSQVCPYPSMISGCPLSKVSRLSVCPLRIVHQNLRREQAAVSSAPQPFAIKEPVVRHGWVNWYKRRLADPMQLTVAEWRQTCDRMTAESWQNAAVTFTFASAFATLVLCFRARRS